MTSEQRVNQLVDAIFGSRFYVSQSDSLKYHIKYKRDDKKSCLIINFEPDLSYLYIVSLAKCGPKHDLRSGTMLLSMVDALARLIPECRTIYLEDESNVYRCSHDIDLASLTILLTGVSWYNRLGYKQGSYESDKEYNHGIRNMHIRDAETELLASSKIRHYPKFVKYKQELDGMLELVNADLTLSEYIKILYDAIKLYPEKQCSEYKKRHAKLATYVINAFGHLLYYSSSVLMKDVVHGKHIPPFIDPLTMTAFEFEPEDIFNCGECGRVLSGDDLPPWNAEPKGVKYYTTRGEGEDEELICHDCAVREETARSPKASKSPKASSASDGGARKSRTTTKRCKPMRRTRRCSFRK